MVSYRICKGGKSKIWGWTAQLLIHIVITRENVEVNRIDDDIDGHCYEQLQLLLTKIEIPSFVDKNPEIYKTRSGSKF